MSRKPREKNGAAAERILATLQSLGKADDHRHIAIRTNELAERANVDRHNLARIVQPLIDAGQVLVCKITTPGVTRGTPQNEYRLATMAQGSFVPLNTKRAGIAHGAPTKPLPITTPAPKVSTPRPDIMNIEPASLGAPKRVGGSKPPAAGKPETPPGAPAVAAPATPAPPPGVALKKEPTARPVSAGDVPPRPQRINGNDGIALRIDHDGTLLIATDEGVLEIDPKQSRRLGHFMADTHGVWNPF